MSHGRCLIAMVLMACGTSQPLRSDHRYANADQHYSVDLPDGWTTSSVRGSTQFSSEAGKHVVVIRSAARPHEMREGHATSNSEIAVATKQVLQAIPGAKLKGTDPVEGEGLHGVRFTLEFVPVLRAGIVTA